MNLSNVLIFSSVELHILCSSLRYLIVLLVLSLLCGNFDFLIAEGGWSSKTQYGLGFSGILFGLKAFTTDSYLYLIIHLFMASTMLPQASFAGHFSGICAGVTLRMVAALGLIDLFTAVVLMHNYRVLSSFATFITPEANKEKKVHGDLTRLVDRRNVKARPSHFASSGGARLGGQGHKANSGGAGRAAIARSALEPKRHRPSTNLRVQPSPLQPSQSVASVTIIAADQLAASQAIEDRDAAKLRSYYENQMSPEGLAAWEKLRSAQDPSNAPPAPAAAPAAAAELLHSQLSAAVPSSSNVPSPQLPPSCGTTADPVPGQFGCPPVASLLCSEDKPEDVLQDVCYTLCVDCHGAECTVKPLCVSHHELPIELWLKPLHQLWLKPQQNPNLCNMGLKKGGMVNAADYRGDGHTATAPRHRA